MKRYRVNVSIPDTYEGLSLWVDAYDEQEAKAQVALLLKVAREHPEADARVVVEPS